MLIDNSETIQIIKFITGEEVICKKVNDQTQSSDTLCITTALTFVMGFNPEYPTQGEVSFSPWLVGASLTEKHIINKSAIITITKPAENVETKYNTALSMVLSPSNQPSKGITGPTMVGRK